MNKINIKSRFLFALSVVFCLTLFMACDDTETIDKRGFTISYPGMVDIGPSMTGIVTSPSYIGSEPSNFEIVRVTLNDEAIDNRNFEIDSTTGAITINNTAGIPVGLYKLSVSCLSGGKNYEYKDIVEVNMMKSVPDGISVDPSKIDVDYAVMIDTNSEIALPTAQVKTDGNHVSITRYEIANSDISKYFTVSSTGLISIKRGSVGLEPGKYILSLKLTTGASGDEEGIYENALEVNITSKPLALVYAPNTGKIESESILSGKTTFKSIEPTVKGSKDELQYSISKVIPATNKVEIDPTTGAILVKENHGLAIGDKYIVSVNVKNKYATDGVNFEDVFELEVVAYIEPIDNFNYPNISATQAVGFEVILPAEFKGDEVSFEFVNLSEQLKSNLSIGLDGKITAAKGHTIPLGTHTIGVKATNPKGEVETSFTLTVESNPNYFTYVRYGNNLGLTPEASYANQIRIPIGGSLSHSEIGRIPTTDATQTLIYEIQPMHQTKGSTIDSGTGAITLSTLAANQMGVVMVTATAGKGTASEFSITTPVFFQFASGVGASKVFIDYKPFVAQVNPRTGGRSAKPTVNSDLSLFKMDYRRAFNYYNFFGTHTSGAQNVNGSFLNSLWVNYYTSINKPVQSGSKDPVSYYSNSANVTQTLLYVDPGTLEVVVNPNKWTHEGEVANGVFSGQITFVTNGVESGINSGAQAFPILIWFDKNF